MKYSFVLAGLAASTIATPFVDIVVGEDAVTTSSRSDHRHHDNRGWLSSLLGSSHRHRNVYSPRKQTIPCTDNFSSTETITMTTAIIATTTAATAL